MYLIYSFGIEYESNKVDYIIVNKESAISNNEYQVVVYETSDLYFVAPLKSKDGTKEIDTSAIVLIL